MFKKGNSANLKGRPKGSKGGGRPPDWIKHKCQDIIDRSKLIEFLADVARGEELDTRVIENGEVIKIPAAVKDRIRAVELLLERGYGKSIQQIESDSLTKMPYSIIVKIAEPEPTIIEAEKIDG